MRLRSIPGLFLRSAAHARRGDPRDRAEQREPHQEQLRELRGRCVQEVKKTHGMISLDDAVEYQNGGDGV